MVPEMETTILIPFNKEELIKTPRVRKLFIAYGEEKFIHEVLEKYFSDSEIGKIFAGGLKNWQSRLEKLLKEASEAKAEAEVEC